MLSISASRAAQAASMGRRPQRNLLRKASSARPGKKVRAWSEQGRKGAPVICVVPERPVGCGTGGRVLPPDSGYCPPTAPWRLRRLAGTPCQTRLPHDVHMPWGPPHPPDPTLLGLTCMGLWPVEALQPLLVVVGVCRRQGIHSGSSQGRLGPMALGGIHNSSSQDRLGSVPWRLGHD